MYGRINEIRALVPSGTPVIALTATVTKIMRADICKKLELSGCKLIRASPNRPNIYYEVVHRQDVKEDMSLLANQLKAAKIAMPRTIIYCRSLNLCADLYCFFLECLGDSSYYPPGATKLIVQWHSNPIVHFLIKAPKLVHIIL